MLDLIRSYWPYAGSVIVGDLYFLIFCLMDAVRRGDGGEESRDWSDTH